MKGGLTYYNLILFLLLLSSSVLHGAKKERKQLSDIYIIIYATQEGITGHTGLAVDNYDVFIRDIEIDGRIISKKDTISNGTLTYFDMFGPPEIRWEQYKDKLEARFYKFPRSSAEKEITVDYLVSKGIPHEYDTACDALIRIPSKAKLDLELIEKINLIKKENNYFNPSSNNCVDFVINCIEAHSGIKIDAKEDLVFMKANTPNQLYKKLIQLKGIEIIKEPGEVINASFFKEIVQKKYLINLNLY